MVDGSSQTNPLDRRLLPQDDADANHFLIYELPGLQHLLNVIKKLTLFKMRWSNNSGTVTRTITITDVEYYSFSKNMLQNLQLYDLYAFVKTYCG